MIVKMIQNFKNKMEFQINRVETNIKKMQEIFNKDLEEIKKGQPIMNNAIIDCSTSSFPGPHHLPKFAQAHVHVVHTTQL